MSRRSPSETIVFSHANGFPAGTYALLFDRWREAGFRVIAVDKYGHDPRWPVTSNWPHLRDQLIHVVETEARGPVYFVGHSLGGFLSVLAASRRPELARGVVLLDSPLFSPLLAGALGVAKFTGVLPYASPGNVSRRRRTHWPSAEAAYEHFAVKPAFARWHPEVLRDYVTAGFEPCRDPDRPGITLAFRREVETRIYNTLPDHLPATLRAHPLRCPAAFIGGRDSTEVRQVGLRETERVTHRRVSWIDGSHLFPFERPLETADEVLRWLKAFAALDAQRRPEAA